MLNKINTQLRIFIDMDMLFFLERKFEQFPDNKVQFKRGKLNSRNLTRNVIYVPNKDDVTIHVFTSERSHWLDDFLNLKTRKTITWVFSFLLCH